VYSARFNYDDKRIVTGHWDGVALVWDRSSDQPRSLLRGHVARVTSAAFSMDGKTILTASRDATARLWDVEGNPLAVLCGHDKPLLSAAFDPEGKRVVTAGGDAVVGLWEAGPAVGRTAVLQQGSSIESAEFSRSGDHLVIAEREGIARVWKLTES